MRTQHDLERENEMQAIIQCIIAIAFMALGVWRATEGEWIPASVLFVGSGLMLR